MEQFFDRTEQLIGKKHLALLRAKHVAVAGLGGVGSYACEALARSGIGALTLIDHDTVTPSNINRQLYALTETIGKEKTEIARGRIAGINPLCRVKTNAAFLDETNVTSMIPGDCDYIIDAIDTVNSKMILIEYAKKQQIPIISSMGMGNKLDPTRLEVADIYKTSVCPLAKIMRKLCKEAGIQNLAVVYSKELPLIKQTPPASMIFVPAAAGILMAEEAVLFLAELSKCYGNGDKQ